MHFVDHFALLPATNEVAGRLCFHKCLSVIVFWLEGGGGGPHVTITHDALDLTVQPSPSRHGTWGPLSPRPTPY